MKNFFDAYGEKTPLSEKLFKRSKEVMPGGISHNLHYFPPHPFFIKKAQGSKIWDVDGNEYVDLWMGNYTHILGHRPKVIIEALERQLNEGIHWGILFEKQVEWAELVRDLLPSAEMVRFCCSGTEATMYAVRLARALTGRKTIFKIAGSWHGANSDLSVGIKMPYDREEGQGLLPELQKYTKLIPFNDIPAASKIIRQNEADLAAIILEPAITDGGFSSASRGYLELLRSETERLGSLLIFDEIITGFRVSLGGAQERFRIMPDLTTLGKIMGGGLPVGGLAGKREILEKSSPAKKAAKWEKVLIGGGTFSANPMTAAAGLTMLHYLQDNAEEVYPCLETKGKMVRDGVSEAFRSEGIDAVVTGIGSLFQVHFPIGKAQTYDSPQSINQFTDIEKREGEFRIRMLTNGVHLIHGGGSLSMAHTDEDIEKIILATKRVAKEMA